MKLRILAVSIALALGSLQAQTRNAETVQSTALTQGGVTATHQRGTTGKGSVIGIIDQGFDLTHTDIRSQVLGSMNFAKPSAVTWGSHGTAMASIAAGARNQSGTLGVAPDSRLLLAQVGAGGTSLLMDQRAIKLALDWLSGQGATVINMSFGGAYDSVFLQTLRYQPVTKTYVGQPITNSILDYKLATDRGSVLVMAAGNQGLPFAQYPALYAVQTDARGNLVLGGRALIVGAVDGANQIANYSNRAGHLCVQSVGTSCRDLVKTMDYFVVAPGTLQAATANQLGRGTNTAATVTGTSGAAAYVSGGIALMRQAWPTVKPEQLVAIVLKTTKDLGAPGTDSTYGRGLVDFERATRPLGLLLFSGNNYTLGQGGQLGASVYATGVGGGIAQKFTSTSVLSQAQAIDEMGRNYAVNLAAAVWQRAPNYDPASPYLAFTGYQPLRFSIDSTDIGVHVAATGSAVDFARQFGSMRLGYQLGSMQERQGFVGNYGSGALDLGSSNTAWHMVSAELELRTDLSLRLAYGRGVSTVVNAPLSMVEFRSGVGTETAQLGLVSQNWLRRHDRLTVGVGVEPTVRNGTAKVTAVTGYDYHELEDGTVLGKPQIHSEIVDLKQPYRAIMFAGYTSPLSTNSYLTTSLSGNQFGHRFGVNFTWIQ